MHRVGMIIGHTLGMKYKNKGKNIHKELSYSAEQKVRKVFDSRKKMYEEAMKISNNSTHMKYLTSLPANRKNTSITRNDFHLFTIFSRGKGSRFDQMDKYFEKMKNPKKKPKKKRTYVY